MLWQVLLIGMKPLVIFVMKKAIVIILLLVILTTGCSSNKIQEGTISEKEHTDDWVQLIMMPIIISNGDTISTTYMPMYIFHPESWQLKISEYNPDKDKFERNSFYVEENVYKSVSIGDYFIFKEDLGSEEEQTYKIKKSDIKESDLEGFELVE